MTKDKVKKHLSEIISGEDGEEIIATRDNRFVKIERFVIRFKGAELNYQSLSGHENAVGSWQDIFDEWKDKGYIN